MPLPSPQLQEALQAVGAFLQKRRPPEHIRAKLDMRADINNNEVIIRTLRPYFMDANQIIESPFARAKWVGTRKVWRLYWMRSDLKWHAYQPFPEAATLGEVLAEVDRDPHGCFFG
jgi:hypothetical protein